MHQMGVAPFLNHYFDKFSTKTWSIGFCYCKTKRAKLEFHKRNNLQASTFMDSRDKHKKTINQL